MTEDVIERYDVFNTKVFPYKTFSCNLNGQPIPPNYYDLLNDDYDDGNNITGNSVDNELPDKERV